MKGWREGNASTWLHQMRRNERNVTFLSLKIFPINLTLERILVQVIVMSR